MYVAMLLTDWCVLVCHIPTLRAFSSGFALCSGHSPMCGANMLPLRNVVKSDTNPNHDQDVYIGRSVVAMWMRIVSSWVCMALYIWSLLAPVIMPDR